MAQIARTGQPSVRRQHDRFVATFKLSDEPDRVWVKHFRSRAIYSIFDVEHAVFSGNELSIELQREQDLGELIKAVDRFIDGANLDTR